MTLHRDDNLFLSCMVVAVFAALLLIFTACGAYTCNDLGIVIEDATLGKARVTLTCDAEPILTAEGHLEFPTSTP